MTQSFDSTCNIYDLEWSLHSWTERKIVEDPWTYRCINQASSLALKLPVHKVRSRSWLIKQRTSLARRFESLESSRFCFLFLGGGLNWTFSIGRADGESSINRSNRVGRAPVSYLTRCSFKQVWISSAKNFRRWPSSFAVRLRSTSDRRIVGKRTRGGGLGGGRGRW